jgi:hypothetical protein
VKPSAEAPLPARGNQEQSFGMVNQNLRENYQIG